MPTLISFTAIPRKDLQRGDEVIFNVEWDNLTVTSMEIDIKFPHPPGIDVPMDLVASNGTYTHWQGRHIVTYRGYLNTTGKFTIDYQYKEPNVFIAKARTLYPYDLIALEFDSNLTILANLTGPPLNDTFAVETPKATASSSFIHANNLLWPSCTLFLLLLSL